MIRKCIFLIIFFVGFSCSEKVHNNLILQNKSLLGRIYPLPNPPKTAVAVITLYYNDTTKISTGADLDGYFSISEIDSKLISENSFVYILNKGCIPKKILFKKFLKNTTITLTLDSIKGTTHEEYVNYVSKNRAIDKYY